MNCFHSEFYSSLQQHRERGKKKTKKLASGHSIASKIVFLLIKPRSVLYTSYIIFMCNMFFFL